jgi:LPXTG-motif cell wall-anchored protein
MYGSGGGIIGGGVVGGTLAHTGSDPVFAVIAATVVLAIGILLTLRRRLIERHEPSAQ